MSYKLGTYPFLEEALISCVKENPAIKATALIADLEVMSYVVEIGQKFNKFGITLEIINALVEAKKIIEVEYILLNHLDRVKSLFFPAGTVIKLP